MQNNQQSGQGPEPDPRNAEQSRIDSQEQLRFLQVIIDAIPIPIFYKDTNGRYLGCNLEFERYVGLSKDELMGKSVFDLFPKDLAEIYHKKDQELFKEGGIQEYESYVASKNGIRHNVVFYKETFLNEEGLTGGLVGVIFDITERKKMEEALRNSRAELGIRVKVRTAELSKANEDLHLEIDKRIRVQEELDAERKLFISGPTVVFKWKAQEGWPVEYVSENVLMQFGYEPADFMKGKILYASLIHPNDRKKLEKDVQGHSKEGSGCFDEEYRIRCADGLYKWVHVFIVVPRDSDGRITHYHGHVNDITAYKLTEEKRKSSELQYRMTLDSMGEAVYVVDRQLRIILVNKVFTQWNKNFKIKSHVIGKHLFDVYPFLSESVREDYQKVFKTGKIMVAKEKIKIKNKKFSTETRKIPILEGGKVARVVTVIKDLTTCK
ncbi:MAG: PAS domain S-box protein [Candidatus Omnitrophota bacterium]|jgi:PAS domain S-box-containing protein